jgi:cytoskeletal protein RodZ
MSNDPTDVGLLLKQERERKGISLEVVHESTKVPMDALRAIEEGYKVRTLTAFYYKSFVKIYAQYLGLDANHVVSLIPTHHPKPVTSVYPLRKVDPASRPMASGAGAHKVEGVRSWNLLAHPIVLKKKKKVLKVAVILAALVLGFILAGMLVRKVVSVIKVNQAMDAAVAKKAPKASVKKMAMPVKAVEVKTNAVKAVAPAEKPPVAAPAEEKPVKAAITTPAAKQVVITVRAQTTTWVRVDVDESGTAFQGRLKKGSSATWRGTKKIVLSANDIGALEFEVNGRSVGKLARNYLKAKKVVVTPEGLTVEK